MPIVGADTAYPVTADLIDKTAKVSCSHENDRSAPVGIDAETVLVDHEVAASACC
jgi:hypothetical protein